MYRKIYESKFGKIPKDADGRSMEIHHIDGDRDNNDISNLKLVTIQEHYDIHYKQGDWGACQAIVRRMKKSLEETAKECSELVKKRIQSGKMPQLTSEYARQRELDKVKRGVHAWQGPVASKRVSDRNLKRVEDGTNPFAGERGSELSKKVQKERVENGTHPFSGEQGSKHSTQLNYKLLREGRHPSQRQETIDKMRQSQLKRVEAGIHVFQDQMKNGTHPTQQMWTCPHCGKIGKGLSNAKRHHYDNCKLKGTI